MLDLITSTAAIRLIVLFALFLIVVSVAYYAIAGGDRRARLARGIKDIEDSGASTTSALAGREKESTWTRVADRVEKAGLSLKDSNYDELQLKLRAAGYTSKSAPRVYTLVRLILVFVLPGWYLLIASMAEEPPSGMRIYLICSALALAGLYIPNLFIRAKADRRREEIINGFPDCLDLLLVCVEAGLGLEAALGRVGREMIGSHKLIAELLVETTYRLRAGAAREDALHHLSDSAGVDEIRSFATLLIQSDKLGTSISQTLRVYAGEMREARRLRAEERAHRLPVLISIPLVACMLPTMIGVLALPAIVRYVREVSPAMGG